jgi:hypothetical protein
MIGLVAPPVATARRSPLLTRQEAADICHISIRTFERAVQPHLAVIVIGSRVLIEQEDLRTWLDDQKVGSSDKIGARGTSTRASRTTAVAATSSSRAREIAARLKARQLASTPRLFPVDTTRPTR